MPKALNRRSTLRASSDSGPGEEEGEDAMQYEIIDYDDPNYETDQGNYDELPERLTKGQTEEAIEVSLASSQV